MERESENVRIPMFDGMNFPSWKFRMLVVLEEHELRECVEQEMEEVDALTIRVGDTEAVKKEKEIKAEKWR